MSLTQVTPDVISTNTISGLISLGFNTLNVANIQVQTVDSGTGNTLVFRANTAERMRITAGGQVAISASGSASAPVISKSDDLNTGIFFPAADTIAFAEGGVEALRLNANGRVGIGTTETEAELNVYGTVNTPLSSTTFWVPDHEGMVLRNLSTTTNTVTGISFQGGASGTSISGLGNILESTSLGALAFFTGGSGRSNTVPERMRIASDGNVGIGNSIASSFNEFANRLVVGTGSGSQGITVYAGSTGGSSLSFADGPSGTDSFQGYITYAHSDDSMRFHVNYAGNAAARMFINSSGNVGIATTNPVVSLDISSNNAIRIPVGTTAQRPGSPAAGMIRHNSDTDEPEWYDDQNTTWRAFAEKSYNGYSVDYLIVAGGGAPGGSWSTGGGAGGGVVEGTVLVNSATSYRVIIGAGASPQLTESATWGVNGSNSSFQDLIAVGGGGGGGWQFAGQRGGSGGGGSSGTQVQGYPVYRQGFAGGTGTNNGVNYAGGGGGGAGGIGENAGSVTVSGRGGAGHWSTITGSGTWYAAGGAGGTNSSFSSGGQGSTNPGVSGGANTGTGGGGNSGPGGATGKGSGGSGIVVIRYAGSQRGTGGTVTTTSIEGTTYTVHTFTSSGTYTA